MIGDAAQDKGEDDRGGIVGHLQRAEEHGPDEAYGVGLEDVRGHPGAIAHVIAHIIGDRGRVAGIVLVEVALDLAHQIGADIRGLRVNTAAEPGENGYQRGAKREADQALDRLIGTDEALRHQVKDAHRQQREAHYQQPGYRAAIERGLERAVPVHGRRLRGPRIGQHGDAHPDKPGGQRAGRPDDEPERSRAIPQAVVLEDEKQHKDDRRDAGDRQHLPAKVRLRSLLDSARDLAHPLIPRRCREDAADEPASGHEADDCAKEGERNALCEKNLGCEYHIGAGRGAGRKGADNNGCAQGGNAHFH